MTHFRDSQSVNYLVKSFRCYQLFGEVSILPLLFQSISIQHLFVYLHSFSIPNILLFAVVVFDYSTPSI